MSSFTILRVPFIHKFSLQQFEIYTIVYNNNSIHNYRYILSAFLNIRNIICSYNVVRGNTKMLQTITEKWNKNQIIGGSTISGRWSLSKNSPLPILDNMASLGVYILNLLRQFTFIKFVFINLNCEDFFKFSRHSLTRSHNLTLTKPICKN